MKSISLALVVATMLAAPAYAAFSSAIGASADPRPGLETLRLAQTEGQDRRDDRSDDRNDRQDDRQDCRTAEGAGADKRDCKQDARGDDDVSTDG